MRVMMALLLGLYLVVPARAADGGPVLLRGCPARRRKRRRATAVPIFWKRRASGRKGWNIFFAVLLRNRVQDAGPSRPAIVCRGRRPPPWRRPCGSTPAWPLWNARWASGSCRKAGKVGSSCGRAQGRAGPADKWRARFFRSRGCGTVFPGMAPPAARPARSRLPGARSLRHRMTGWPEMPEASGARPLYRVPQLRRGRPLRTALQRRGRPAR